MAETSERPIQGLTLAEAAEILGLAETSVPRLVRQGRLHRPTRWMRRGLDRAEVEALALERRRPGDGLLLGQQHRGGGDPRD
jgi:DNA-directed RNA polymerase specialized sigma24 family protein